jgi:branched-chain amino acid transport system substrate-binding protein
MRAIAAVVVLVVAAGAAGCGSGGGSGGGGAKQLDLVIGNSVPLTGPLAEFGPSGEKSANLAAAQIRKAIRTAGADHTVRVVSKDSGPNPSAAVASAKELVDTDGASCITGAWAAADTIPIAQAVTIPDQVLQISPASTVDEITKLDDDGLLDRTVPPDALQGPSLAEAIAADLGGAEGRTVNIGKRSDDYGDTIASSFRDAWEGLGGDIGEEASYDPEQPTYTGDAVQITEGDPDAFLIVDFPETFAKLAPALQQAGGWDPSKAWTTAALGSPELPAEAGGQVVEGMRGITPGSPKEADPSRAFNSLYVHSAPESVGRKTFDAQEFDATILCYLAAVSAGSTDGKDMADALIDLTAPGGTEYSWQQLPDAIEALQNGEDINYIGASGPIDMDANGDATAGVYDVFRFGNGRRLIVGEVPVTTVASG